MKVAQWQVAFSAVLCVAVFLGLASCASRSKKAILSTSTAIHESAATPTAVLGPVGTNDGAATTRPGPEARIRSAGGIAVAACHLRFDGSGVMVDLCYDMLDNSDWTIYKASLSYSGERILWSGASPTEIREFPVDGQQRVTTFEGGVKNVRWEQAADTAKGQKWDTVSFDVLPASLPPNLTISLDALAAYPREDEYCTSYLQKVQGELDARAIGIKLKCTNENGIERFSIISKPDLMTQEQAERIVSSDEFFTVKGPWLFSFYLGR